MMIGDKSIASTGASCVRLLCILMKLSDGHLRSANSSVIPPDLPPVSSFASGNGCCSCFFFFPTDSGTGRSTPEKSGLASPFSVSSAPPMFSNLHGQIPAPQRVTTRTAANAKRSLDATADSHNAGMDPSFPPSLICYFSGDSQSSDRERAIAAEARVEELVSAFHRFSCRKSLFC